MYKRQIIKTFVTSVNKIMHRPIFTIPNMLVNRNSRSMIHPNKSPIGPKTPPAFVNITAPTKLFNELPPYERAYVRLLFLRNWIITAFCKRLSLIHISRVGNVDEMMQKMQEKEEKEERQRMEKIAKTKAIVEENKNYYNADAKPGSLASKANMVAKYNEKHEKGGKK